MYGSRFNISGQWLGHFEYGPEYDDLYGEKVTFSFILEDLGDDQFIGKCHELEGIGAQSEVSIVKGYIEGNEIHLVKEYPNDYLIEEDGSLTKEGFYTKPILIYTGEYNERTKTFEGSWEVEINHGPTVHGDVLDFFTGKWEMHKL